MDEYGTGEYRTGKYRTGEYETGKYKRLAIFQKEMLGVVTQVITRWNMRTKYDRTAMAVYICVNQPLC